MLLVILGNVLTLQKNIKKLCFQKVEPAQGKKILRAGAEAGATAKLDGSETLGAVQCNAA